MYAPAIALEAVCGLPLWVSITSTAAVAIIYTTLVGDASFEYFSFYTNLVLLFNSTRTSAPTKLGKRYLFCKYCYTFLPHLYHSFSVTQSNPNPSGICSLQQPLPIALFKASMSMINNRLCENKLARLFFP